MFEKIVEFLDGFIDTGVPGFDCLIYKDGKEIFRHMNGYSDLENKIKVNGNEIYNIYSCSKPITCVCALQLLEKNKYSLDDNLCDYMSEFTDMYVKDGDSVRKTKNKIKVRDLFCMTAGFSYDVDSPSLKQLKTDTNGRCPTREAMKYLAKEPLLFEPGERWEYGFSHDVLAAFVEVISGVKFEDYAKENIFDVLGMKDTTFMLPEKKLDKICQQYRFIKEKNIVENCGKQIYQFKLGSEYASGGAGCISTVRDYMKFLEALRIGDTILRKSTVDLMSKNMLNSNQLKSFWREKEGYGYGLGVRCPNKAGVTDFGWAGAASSYLVIDRINNISIFIAMHIIDSLVLDTRKAILSYVKKELGIC